MGKEPEKKIQRNKNGYNMEKHGQSHHLSAKVAMKQWRRLAKIRLIICTGKGVGKCTATYAFGQSVNWYTL